ncbi:rod shape-determining protein MreD [Flavicella marina]|uniref:rod shape-determining protein MreD n=1 Tax=Flavicella marina TaxID=1475951 RepID=UPI001264AE3F|nr:rod shape-determining protein MreD [Flavicella marina]
MTRETLIIGFRFVLLLLIQTLILNRIHLFGFLNPNAYLLFIFLYPVETKRANFLIVSFLFGLCIDLFSNTGGINAAATVATAYLTLPLIKIIWNSQDLDFQLFKLNNEPLPKTLVYISLLTLVHHFLLFSIEYWSLREFGTVLYKTFSTSVVTIFLCILGLYLTKKGASTHY